MNFNLSKQSAILQTTVTVYVSLFVHMTVISKTCRGSCVTVMNCSTIT